MEHYCKTGDFNVILRKWTAADVRASTFCGGRQPLRCFFLKHIVLSVRMWKIKSDWLGNKCAVLFMVALRTSWLFSFLNRSKVKCQHTQFPPLLDTWYLAVFPPFHSSVGGRPWQLVSVGLKLCATSPFYSPASLSLSATLCLHRANVLF